ncbi:MAG: hypothetical protein ACYTDW_09130 [Planctomycetota bacterium]|jgi:hypothetical protein
MAGKTIAERSAKALATIEQTLGGRLAVIEALQYADLGADETRVVERISDPDNDKLSLYRVCAEEGVGVGKFLQIFQQAAITKSILNALVAQADRVGDVVEDVMDRALPLDVPCPKCHGEEKEKPCIRCTGTGKIKKPPSISRQKLALDLYRMLQKGGPQIVAINQNLTDPGKADRMLKTMMEATDRVLYARDQIPGGEDVSAPIDVEVKEVEQEAEQSTSKYISAQPAIDAPHVIQPPAGSRPEEVPP